MIFSLLWFLFSRAFGAHKLNEARADAMVARATRDVAEEMARWVGR